jgi:pentatricopeptide repeat protein
VTCYNAVVSACARCAQPERAFLVVEEMLAAGVTPSARTSSALLNACASAGLVQRAEGVVADMRRRGHAVDEYVHAALIDCHARAGGRAEGAAGSAAAALARCASLAEEARALGSGAALSDGSRGLPRVVFNALLGAHVALRDFSGALALFDNALGQGVALSTTTYRHAIGALLRAAGGTGGALLPHGGTLPAPRRAPDAAAAAAAAAALARALALYDAAAAAGIAANVETRREIINFAVGLLGGAHTADAFAAASRVLADHVAAAGFINTPDGSAWLSRAVKPELGAEGLTFAHAVWDAMVGHARTPSGAATTAYLRAMEARAPGERRRIAAARATVTGRGSSGGASGGGGGGAWAQGGRPPADADAAEAQPPDEEAEAAAHAAAARDAFH